MHAYIRMYIHTYIYMHIYYPRRVAMGGFPIEMCNRDSSPPLPPISNLVQYPGDCCLPALCFRYGQQIFYPMQVSLALKPGSHLFSPPTYEPRLQERWTPSYCPLMSMDSCCRLVSPILSILYRSDRHPGRLSYLRWLHRGVLCAQGANLGERLAFLRPGLQFRPRLDHCYLRFGSRRMPR